MTFLKLNRIFWFGFFIESDKIKSRINPWNEGSNKVKLNDGKNIIFANKNPKIENVDFYEDDKLKYFNNNLIKIKLILILILN